MAGRKPLKEGEKTAYIGTKAPKSVDDFLKTCVLQLKNMGFEDVDKSKLVRALIEYRMANAVIIYREVDANRKRTLKKSIRGQARHKTSEQAASP